MIPWHVDNLMLIEWAQAWQYQHEGVAIREALAPRHENARPEQKESTFG